MKILIGEEAITEVCPCSGGTDLFFFAEIWNTEVADVSFLQRNVFCKLPLPATPFTYVLLQEDHTDPGFHTRKIINSFIQPISSYTERICAQSCAAVGLEMGPTADSSVTTNRWPGL